MVFIVEDPTFEYRVAMCCYFFFFQAEDGIRDLTVTGVQTCALPIYLPFPIGEAWVIGQTNAVTPTDSHRDQFAYCWDLNFAQGASKGRSIVATATRSEEHTSELQSQSNLVCRLLLEKKKGRSSGCTP